MCDRSVRSLFPLSFGPLANSNLLSDLCLTSNTTGLPHHHHVFNSLSHILQLPFTAGLLIFFYILLLLFYLALSVSLWIGFSVGTGCGSAGSRGIVTDQIFLGDGVQRSCSPLLLALELKLGQGWGLRIGRWF